MSDNGRRTGRQGYGIPGRLPAAYKDSKTPTLSPSYGTRETRLSQPPSPTQKLSLWLQRERAGWGVAHAEEGREPGLNAAWPLAMRRGLAL